MKFRIAVLMVLSLLICNFSYADSGARREAEILLDMVGAERMLKQSIEQMLELELKQNPALKPYKQVMLKFFEKYMSYESLKPDFVTIYAEAFTESELKEINAFYRTPIGRKTIEKLPELMRKGGQIGVKRVQENIIELQQMIKAEADRIERMQSQ